MDSLQLFTERLPALESLPEKPSILWYPSAGVDFRSPVFLTKHHINFVEKHHGRNFIKPNLYVYSCLGPEVLELKEKLALGDFELRNDHSTRIVAKNYQSMQLKEDLIFEINDNYIDFENLNLNDLDSDRAFYFEIEVSGENYSEIQKILYFESENIDFFNKIILKNIFDTQYLCCTREGLAWGGCKKSIIEYVYSDNHPHFFSEYGFTPKFQILSNNYTKVIFEDAVEGSISVEPNYSKFISESEKYPTDSVIYKLDYP